MKALRLDPENRAVLVAFGAFFILLVDRPFLYAGVWWHRLVGRHWLAVRWWASERCVQAGKRWNPIELYRRYAAAWLTEEEFTYQMDALGGDPIAALDRLIRLLVLESEGASGVARQQDRPVNPELVADARLALRLLRMKDKPGRCNDPTRRKVVLTLEDGFVFGTMPEYVGETLRTLYDTPTAEVARRLDCWATRASALATPDREN